ncbi:MAG: glycoside hydrolase family 127 protein [Jatrophihabitans sp.]
MTTSLPAPTGMSDDSEPAGCVDLGRGRHAVLHPVGAAEARIDGGYWAARQDLNRSVTLREGLRQLHEAGDLHNFALAAGTAQGPYRGELYLDSDVYKWLEAVAWDSARGAGAAFATEADEITALIASAQAPDGYLNTYVQVTSGAAGRYQDLACGHELFCGGHLIQAGIAQYRATGRSELLEVAGRYADHLTRTFGPDLLNDIDGHPEIETALVELWRTTGERRYLDLAQFFLDARGHGLNGANGYGFDLSYFQDDVPIRAADTIRGHAVRALFLNAGATDLYLETGETALLDAMVSQWEDMTTGKMYLTGGLGSRWEGEAFGDSHELPPDRAYAETCAAHASILWSWRLLLATGEARFAELIERTLFNGFASGLSADGTSFFYVNPLQVRSNAARDGQRNPAAGRRGWYSTACCPPNVMRQLASVNQFIATTDEHGLQIHQYAASTVRTMVGGQQLEVRMHTDYPWDGEMIVEVLAAPGQPVMLSLRVPEWSQHTTLDVAGTERSDEARPGSYVHLEQAFSAGDTIRLGLDLHPRATVADSRVDAVRGTAALERGPLVYCFESVDQPAGVDLDTVRFDPAHITERWSADVLQGVPTLHCTAVAPAAADGLTYRPMAERRGEGTAVALTAIPYHLWANRDLGAMRVFVPTIH